MIGSVVVLYNPTHSEIENIKKYVDFVDYAVVVDNSNIDNKNLVFNTLAKYREKIEYYSEMKNLGLCKGLNLGIDILYSQGCDFAFVVDSDSRVDSSIFAVYKKAMGDHESQSVAVYAPIHLFDRSNNAPYKGYKDVSWTMTSGWLINIPIFKKQHGFFEPLFVDGLDMDYCFRSHENGYKIIECGEAIVRHNPAETKSFLGFKYGIASPIRYYMQARQLIWCWKRYKRSDVLFIYFYKWIKILFLFPNKLQYIRKMCLGTRDGFLLLKEVRK